MQDQRNSFLIEEFEHLMSYINCPDEYIMDLFISDIMREDYVIEKVSYRRRFEIFLNMTLFREIIRNVGMNNPSEVVVACLIRAGMVFAITEIWKAFIEKRHLCGYIATSMVELKQKISAKTKATKSKTVKAVVTKTKRTKAEKLSKVVFNANLFCQQSLNAKSC